MWFYRVLGGRAAKRGQVALCAIGRHAQKPRDFRLQRVALQNLARIWGAGLYQFLDLVDLRFLLGSRMRLPWLTKIINCLGLLPSRK